jgi:hypothetical protein
VLCHLSSIVISQDSFRLSRLSKLPFKAFLTVVESFFKRYNYLKSVVLSTRVPIALSLFFPVLSHLPVSWYLSEILGSRSSMQNGSFVVLLCPLRVFPLYFLCLSWELSSFLPLFRLNIDVIIDTFVRDLHC